MAKWVAWTAQVVRTAVGRSPRQRWRCASLCWCWGRALTAPVRRQCLRWAAACVGGSLLTHKQQPTPSCCLLTASGLMCRHSAVIQPHDGLKATCRGLCGEESIIIVDYLCSCGPAHPPTPTSLTGSCWVLPQRCCDCCLRPPLLLGLECPRPVLQRQHRQPAHTSPV